MNNQNDLTNELVAEGTTTAEAPAQQPDGKKSILFVSTTCPNCKLAIQMLDKAQFPYEKIVATERVDLANQYGVKQAPTLVIIDGDQVEKYRGVSDIKGMLLAAKG